jgi:hypothetical protein
MLEVPMASTYFTMSHAVNGMAGTARQEQALAAADGIAPRSLPGLQYCHYGKN